MLNKTQHVYHKEYNRLSYKREKQRIIRESED